MIRDPKISYLNPFYAGPTLLCVIYLFIYLGFIRVTVVSKMI